MKIINGGCTPSMTIEVEFDENPNGLPVVWLKTGYKSGISAPLNKNAVDELIIELQTLRQRM